jgi:DNA invertase Pin-like site-specific DNA recombinase
VCVDAPDLTAFGLFSLKTGQLNMNEQGNDQSQLAKPTTRNRISSERWEQIKTAYASGIGLREIARYIGIPEGTVLARAKREGWTRQIESSKALAKREGAPLAVTPVEAVDAAAR